MFSASWSFFLFSVIWIQVSLAKLHYLNTNPELMEVTYLRVKKDEFHNRILQELLFVNTIENMLQI